MTSMTTKPVEVTKNLGIFPQGCPFDVPEKIQPFTFLWPASSRLLFIVMRCLEFEHAVAKKLANTIQYSSIPYDPENYPMQ